MTIVVEQSQWAGTRAELEAAVAAFGAAKAAHAQTVGVAAPLASDVVMRIHAGGGAFVLRSEVEPETPVVLTPQQAAAAQLAATDKDMARVVEDLWAALKAKGVLADADLPAAARDKIAARAQLRAQA